LRDCPAPDNPHTVTF